MINILVRSHNRPEEFKKCIESIRVQLFKKIHVIAAVDNQATHEYAFQTLTKSGLSFEIARVESNGALPYSWNLYCNTLKDRVTWGWFFYLDDDDWLISRQCLQSIAGYLNDPSHGVICQFRRGKRPKPQNLIVEKGFVKPDSIIKGKIGGSAIILHHTHKNLADWDGNRAADYRFIKAVSEKLPLKFYPIVLVQTGNSGRHGS